MLSVGTGLGGVRVPLVAVQVSLVAASRGYLLVMVHRLLIAMTSVVVAPGL